MHSQHLEYFCKVVEFGSLSRAAISLGINQSALSRHIRNLERELGISLLYRHGRGVVLTDHGKRLLARATRALEEIALAKEEAASARVGGIESVVIGLTPTVGRLLVRPLALELISSFPAIKLRFMEGFSGHLLEWLDAGRLDLAVLYQGRAAGRINSERLITERLSVVSSSKAPSLKATTPTADLSGFSLILPSAPHGLRRLVDLVAIDQRVPLKVGIEADSFESILSLVKANLGSTILPSAAIREELAAGVLQSSMLVDDEVTRTLILATPTNRPLVAGLTSIANTIRRELKKSQTL